MHLLIRFLKLSCRLSITLLNPLYQIVQGSYLFFIKDGIIREAIFPSSWPPVGNPDYLCLHTEDVSATSRQ